MIRSISFCVCTILVRLNAFTISSIKCAYEAGFRFYSCSNVRFVKYETEYEAAANTHLSGNCVIERPGGRRYRTWEAAAGGGGGGGGGGELRLSIPNSPHPTPFPVPCYSFHIQIRDYLATVSFLLMFRRLNV